MIYFMENPRKRWMITGGTPIHGPPPTLLTKSRSLRVAEVRMLCSTADAQVLSETTSPGHPAGSCDKHEVVK